MSVTYYLYNESNQTKVELGRNKHIPTESIEYLIGFFEQAQPYDKIGLCDEEARDYWEYINRYKDPIKGNTKVLQDEKSDSGHDIVLMARDLRRGVHEGGYFK